MISLLNLTFRELCDFVVSIGEAEFRAKQLWRWLWYKGVKSFDEMTDISLQTRQLLSEKAYIEWPEVVKIQTSEDKTQKLLLRLADGALVETVLIPSWCRNGTLRLTQCLSTQVGCAMGCTFCSTGAMGFTRNMSMQEILGQVLVARHHLGDIPHQPLLRNLVFMGMGEPLLNLRELMRSLEVLNNPLGLAFSARRITVSTCGIEAGLQSLGDSGLAYLAVSLHAPNQELRKRLMPKAAVWPLDNMMKALAAYPLKTRERMTFEYLLLGGVNDSIAHAKELVRLLSHVKGKLNLILYNPASGASYKAPSPDAVEDFIQYLVSKHVTVIVRKSKGQDIDAACGQLATKCGAEGIQALGR